MCMTKPRLLPALALAASGVTASGLALTALPAQAAPATGHQALAHPSVAHAVAGHSFVRHALRRVQGPKPLSRSQLSQARARQRHLAAASVTPSFAKAGVTTFHVDTTGDTPLADPTSTACVDAGGKCSLRAAVEAANNRNTPVKIVLGKHTYTLSTATAITVTDVKGVSIVGQGAGHTAVAGDGSGIFYVTTGTGPGSLFLDSLTLRDGSAADGGAVQLAGATLSLDHVTAKNNTASDAGGAIYAYEYTTVSIAHSTFTDNHAANGGALYQYWSDIKVVDSSFDHNSTPAGVGGYGGAVYSYYGIFDMRGGSISDNTAGDASDAGYGGGLYDDGGLTTLTGVHLDHNNVTDDGEGGAISSYEDKLEINGGTISHNHASGVGGAGGGVYTYYSSQLAMHGVTMTGNGAGGNSDFYGGGAVYAYGYEYPTQIVIDDHSKITGSSASAVYLAGYYGGVDASITDSTLADNDSTVDNGYDDMGCGGAVCAYGYEYGPVNLEMQHDKVTGNSSVGNYSAGAVTMYAYYYSPSTAVLRNNTFADNHTGAGGYGGAVGFYTNSDYYSPISVRTAHNAFTGNRAGTQGSAGEGGALSAYYAVTVGDKGSVFKNNRAVGNGAYGGAVSDLTDYGSASFDRSVFTGNSAGTNHSGNSGYGGAIFAEAYAGMSLNDVTMSGNQAAEYGGGFFGDSSNYQLQVTGSTISGNTAGTPSVDGQGGGIYTEEAVTTIENSTVAGNKAVGASGFGGGILSGSGSRFTLRYSTVSGNYAKQGGGVYGMTYGTVLSSILSGNRTAKHGSESDCDVSATAYRLSSNGGNVLGEKSCVFTTTSGDKVSKKPHLGKLKDNGGPTKTMAISAKSPAVGRATYLVPSTDQRGHQRPSNHADAGAYELSKVKKHH
jgi:CSLREA domain-containing protein